MSSSSLLLSLLSLGNMMRTLQSCIDSYTATTMASRLIVEVIVWLLLHSSEFVRKRKQQHHLELHFELHYGLTVVALQLLDDNMTMSRRHNETSRLPLIQLIQLIYIYWPDFQCINVSICHITSAISSYVLVVVSQDY